MVRMGDVNEATILHNLRARFVEDVVYTNIGTILVSINPFKWIDGLYRSELIHEHLHLPPGEIASPHVFQIAAAAFHGLRNERANQSIIISGESGAGKTEATKKCLQFFAEAAGSADKSSGMENKLLSANPILEAFGNAKTVRNNNSSRFGKWMEVHFNGRAQICGSRIINYLLEKSRVVFQAPNERNYHIFYMITAASPPEMRTRLRLQGADAYAYTNRSGSIVVDGLDDHEEFEVLLESFRCVALGVLGGRGAGVDSTGASVSVRVDVARCRGASRRSRCSHTAQAPPPCAPPCAHRTRSPVPAPFPHTHNPAASSRCCPPSTSSSSRSSRACCIYPTSSSTRSTRTRATSASCPRCSRTWRRRPCCSASTATRSRRRWRTSSSRCRSSACRRRCQRRRRATRATRWPRPSTAASSTGSCSASTRRWRAR